MATLPTRKLSPLYVILDISSSIDPIRHANILIQAGVRLLQSRGKRSSPEELVRVCREVRSVCKTLSAPDTVIVVNDHPEAAREAGADGVHLGQDDMSPHDARRICGESAWIGLSTHTIEQVQRSADEPIQYIGFGPIFPTRSKQDSWPVVAVEGLRNAARISKHPIVAIGGITSENASQAFQAGASAVAVISDLQQEVGIQQKIDRYFAAASR